VESKLDEGTKFIVTLPVKQISEKDENTRA